MSDAPIRRYWNESSKCIIMFDYIFITNRLWANFFSILHIFCFLLVLFNLILFSTDKILGIFESSLRYFRKNYSTLQSCSIIFLTGYSLNLILKFFFYYLLLSLSFVLFISFYLPKVVSSKIKKWTSFKRRTKRTENEQNRNRKEQKMKQTESESNRKWNEQKINRTFRVKNLNFDQAINEIFKLFY
jgi:Sec-independent protein translocase protein TatA